MNSEQRIEAVLELLEGKVTASELSARLGVDESELLTWRDTWLAGARANNRSLAPRRGFKALGSLVAVAALVGLVSREAYAASCAAPSLFNNLGLKYFCADDPALADEVNQNTAQLVSLIQQKIGASWGLPDAGASSVGITTQAATVSGASNTLSVTSSAINSSTTLSVQTSGGNANFGGSASFGGGITATGQVLAPNTWQKVYDGTVSVTATVPLTVTLPPAGTYKVFYRGSMSTTADSRILLRVGTGATIYTSYRSFASIEGSAAIGESDLTGIYVNRSSSNRSAVLSGEVTVSVYSESGLYTVVSHGAGISADYNGAPAAVFGFQSEGALGSPVPSMFDRLEFRVNAASSTWAGHVTIYAIPSVP